MWEKLKFLWNIKDLADKVILKLKGSKTVLGAVPLLLWVLIYGIPAVAPEYGFLADIGIWLRDYLVSTGIDFSQTLLTAGGGVTLLGLLDKLRAKVQDKKEVEPPHGG